MRFEFYKYQGTGNDFIIIDNRQRTFKNDTKLINRLCDRKFGIGADGLILLQDPDKEGEHFKMLYFNADGNESSMCGNGARCAVSFARFLGITGDQSVFSTSDGRHKAKIDVSSGLVHLKMRNVTEITKTNQAYFVDTGSPHHVLFVENLADIDVKKEGAEIRNSTIYKDEGVNVNFVEVNKHQDSRPPRGNEISIRTYERGVEDETLSCGTGVTAAALVSHFAGKTLGEKTLVKTPGGNLLVEFKPDIEEYYDIWLTGPAEQVFKGEIKC
ncbi:MAG TPA: diaminopimelate epimerase [Flavobacteriaceae bacterium]|nr:diaminopimelate epimerase [Flavobacteriaceae bacterium]